MNLHVKNSKHYKIWHLYILSISNNIFCDAIALVQICIGYKSFTCCSSIIFILGSYFKMPLKNVAIGSTSIINFCCHFSGRNELLPIEHLLPPSQKNRHHQKWAINQRNQRWNRQLQRSQHLLLWKVQGHGEVLKQCRNAPSRSDWLLTRHWLITDS